MTMKFDINALEYFKNNLSNSIINTNEIESLLFFLLKPLKNDKNEIYKQRMKSYQDILKYFPSEMKQPDSNISDIICE